MPDQWTVGFEAKPREILEQCGLVFRAAALPIVILDAEQHLAVTGPGGLPDVDGIDDMAEVKEAGRRGRESCYHSPRGYRDRSIVPSPPFEPTQGPAGTGLAYKTVAMILVSLVFLFVYLFGAYAYGAATVFGFKEVGPAWGGLDRESAPGARPRLDKPGLALFAISTVWFVLHSLIEFRNLSGDDTSQGWLDLGTLIVFLFPPVIMHTVYLETCVPPTARWRASTACCWRRCTWCRRCLACT